MSVFHLKPSEIKNELNELPVKHTKQQILSMVEALQKDLENDQVHTSLSEKVHYHATKHKEFFFERCVVARSGLSSSI
jgi:hypothetical protein